MNNSLRILVLDNTREADSFGSKNIVKWALSTAPQGSSVVVRRAPDQDIPRHFDFDAVLISGSITSCLEESETWIQPYDRYVTELIQMSKPVLGICYGHQTIARCLFGLARQKPQLRKAQDGEFGWQKIVHKSQSEIFTGIKSEFYTYESHYEEVANVPPGARVIASTPQCQIQAFEVIGKPIFGVQFHPEYGVAEGEASLAKKLKKGERKDWILNHGKGSQLYDENVANRIFGNFFRIAIATAGQSKKSA